MPQYANLGGDSGVASYEVGESSIAVTFTKATKAGHRTYVYNYLTPGKPTVDHMVNLAHAGQGLNSFISSVVKGSYASKH